MQKDIYDTVHNNKNDKNWKICQQGNGVVKL